MNDADKRGIGCVALAILCLIGLAWCHRSCTPRPVPPDIAALVGHKIPGGDTAASRQQRTAWESVHGKPVTLKGTDSRLWIIHLPVSDVTLYIDKGSGLVSRAVKGRAAPPAL